jgi:hypothetical protein
MVAEHGSIANASSATSVPVLHIRHWLNLKGMQA